MRQAPTLRAGSGAHRRRDGTGTNGPDCGRPLPERNGGRALLLRRRAAGRRGCSVRGVRWRGSAVLHAAETAYAAARARTAGFGRSSAAWRRGRDTQQEAAGAPLAPAPAHNAAAPDGRGCGKGAGPRQRERDVHRATYAHPSAKWDRAPAVQVQTVAWPHPRRLPPLPPCDSPIDAHNQVRRAEKGAQVHRGRVRLPNGTAIASEEGLEQGGG
mmetsp:Transcript_3242/g.9626  ORF Transcript_3242/g.9626 Transcript_3242/m.9626 type:complete len:214 (-) Transcript_3242:1305-1946(-)